MVLVMESVRCEPNAVTRTRAGGFSSRIWFVQDQMRNENLDRPRSAAGQGGDAGHGPSGQFAIAAEAEGRHDAVRRKTARHDRRRERAVERELGGRVI